jgi:prepilin-type N-terminal cleavage/methylation domain-containing protein
VRVGLRAAPQAGDNQCMDLQKNHRSQRGFTLIELMLVVVLIGIMSSIAIPFYTRASARAYRSEAQGTLSKLELYFRNTYQNLGTFKGPSIVLLPDVMPDPGNTVPIGQGFDWKPVPGHGWDDLPFPPQGDIRMRYLYQVDATGTVVTLFAYGSFPGFGGTTSSAPNGAAYNYSYKEVLVGNGNSVVVDDQQTVEFPISF